MPDNKEIVQIGDLYGMPIFLGNSSSEIEKIEAEGYDAFCVLGFESYTVESNSSVTTKKTRGALYRVISSAIGRVILPVDDVALQLNQKLESVGTYTMPKLSWRLVEKMDQFFRRVHELHGTEGVVVLTYDPTFLDSENPSDGWNCIAPKQSNTSHECKYEIDEEFMKQKPEDHMICGSVHSHPGMSAYFSGTDHKDQADWDGLHITYGWKGNGPTEYHIEMVMLGKQFEFKPEDIFEPAPKPPIEDEDVASWLEKVEKKTYNTGSTISGTQSRNYQGHNNTTPRTPSRLSRKIELPADAPSPKDNILISTVDKSVFEADGDVFCTLCKVPLISRNIKQGRCMACRSFVAFEDETLEEFHDRYKANGNMAAAELIDPDDAKQPVIFVYANGDTLKFSPDLRKQPSKK